MRDELIRCVKRSRVLQIVYMDDKGVATKRTVRVIKINSSTLTCFCYLRRSRRTFKINNLLAIDPKVERVVM